METVKRLLFKAVLCVSMISIIFATSSLMYVVIHRNLIHNDITRPIYATISTCVKNFGEDQVTSCQKGKTHFNDKLVAGDAYSFYLEINVPESAVNDHINMFSIELFGKSNRSHIRSCRRAMLPYRTTWIRRAYKFINIAFYIFRLKEESQDVSYDLMLHYNDDEIDSVDTVAIEIHSIDLRYSSINIKIAPKYFGIKYTMFHWPILSSVVGIWVISCMVTITTLLGYILLSGCTRILMEIIN